jgi:alanine-glyoxylate transaminase/serine-glyoxylate transaminase/serine-pyruvate transaminase
MEACLVNLLEPGDDVVVGVAGVFGERMAEVARRAGARVTRVETEPGTPLSDGAMAEAIARVRPRVVSFVHAETSTGVCQPVEAIARAARDAGALVVLDCVTSLGGLPLSLDAWGIDAAYSGTQKCLSCPPGLSPATFSARAVDHRARAQDVGAELVPRHRSAGELLRRPARLPSHRADHGDPRSRRGAADRRGGGMEMRAARHRTAAEQLIEGVRPLGFEPLVDARYRLPMLTTLRLPETVRRRGEAELRRALLERYGVEVGGGLGKLAGQVWRIGLMGENARVINVEALLFALRKELEA